MKTTPESNLRSLLKQAEQLDGGTLAQLLLKVRMLQLRSDDPDLPDEQIELIAKLREGGPSIITRACYRDLAAKMRADTITPKELQEVDAILDAYNHWDVERATMIKRLSELLEIAMDDVIDRYELYTPGHWYRVQLLDKKFSHRSR